MKWGGALTLFEPSLGAHLTVRTFGSFDGPNVEAHATWLAPLILKAVEDSATTYSAKGVLTLANKTREIGDEARARLLPQLQHAGIDGVIEVSSFSFAPEDHERLMQAAKAAAKLAREQMMAKLQQPTSSPTCSRCGSGASGRFCAHCGAPLT